MSASVPGTKILQVVRDPRAIIHGISYSWEGSKNKDDRAMAKDCTDLAARCVCHTNARFGRASRRCLTKNLGAVLRSRIEPATSKKMENHM